MKKCPSANSEAGTLRELSQVRRWLGRSKFYEPLIEDVVAVVNTKVSRAVPLSARLGVLCHDDISR